MSDPILRVDNLTKSFGDQPVVNGLSFELRRGESVGLLGANGAGKTTALHMLLGLIEPSAGRIEVFGRDLRAHRLEILQRCNFSSAYASLPNNLRVWQNLLVFSHLYGVARPREKIDRLLGMFEIGHLRKSITGHLSSGESTRLNLCKALLNDPELLLLDEPTASLDPDIADKVRTLLKHIQREQSLTILYTSHNMRDVEEVCDRIIFIHRGRKIAEGEAGAVVRQFRERSLEDLFIRIARSGDVLEEGQT